MLRRRRHAHGSSASVYRRRRKVTSPSSRGVRPRGRTMILLKHMRVLCSLSRMTASDTGRWRSFVTRGARGGKIKMSMSAPGHCYARRTAMRSSALQGQRAASAPRRIGFAATPIAPVAHAVAIFEVGAVKARRKRMVYMLPHGSSASHKMT